MSEKLPEILIADDSKSNRLSLAAAANELDVDILIADSGLEAIRLAIEHKPALILLDVEMPDMDGYQIMNQLSGNGLTNNIPVILMETNFASRKAGLHGSSVWPTEMLYKPINHDQLQTKMSTLIRLSEYRNAVSTIREFEDEMGDKADEGVVGIDTIGRIRYCNPAMIKLLHTRFSELIGTGLETIFEKDFHSTDPNWSEHTVATALSQGKTVQVKKATLWTNIGGKVTTTFVAVPVKDHPVLAGLLVFKDISRRSRADEQVTALSTHDFLTGLANRFKFEEVLSGLIELYKAKTNVLISRKRSAPCAVLYIGLDHFSHINKGLGHNTGDKLLQGVAHRIKNGIAELDIAARLGGDEFTVALTHMFDASNATEQAKKIQKSLDEPFLIDGNEIFTSATIGIATYPECGDTSAELLTNASIAMQSAKTASKHNIRFFTDSLNQNYLNQIELEADLREALTDDLIEFKFQPYVAEDSTPIGYYTSILWQHKVKGLIDATEMLDTLDQQNLQTQLIYKMLREGCAQFVAWKQLHSSRANLKLIIPLPAFHIINTSFSNNLKSAINDSGIDPAHLMLEINETKFDFNLREFNSLANEISQLGVKLSLNLFSSPQTPLTHLFRLNLDMIRINIHAMEDLIEHPKSAIFFKSIISMAHDLGIEVIADGIDQLRQATLVQSLGADAIMGKYVAPATTATNLSFATGESSGKAH
ncbi:MAG: EAL domain-containing protein [Pseudomonadales bacterium]|nr:EAL domain-containing protein [Pseudomonadales bacterium]